MFLNCLAYMIYIAKAILNFLLLFILYLFIGVV